MCYYCLFLFWGGAFRVLWQWPCILPEYKGNSYPTICSMFVATISILSCCAIKQKEPRRIAEALSGIIHLRKQSARSRDRTGTGVTPLVFETNASTNSAIRAVDISFLRQTECKGNERPRIVQYLDYTFVLTCYWLGSYFFFSLHSDMESPPRVFFSAQKGRRKSGCLDSYFFSGRNLSPFCPELFYFSGRNGVQF